MNQKILLSTASLLMWSYCGVNESLVESMKSDDFEATTQLDSMLSGQSIVFSQESQISEDEEIDQFEDEYENAETEEQKTKILTKVCQFVENHPLLVGSISAGVVGTVVALWKYRLSMKEMIETILARHSQKPSSEQFQETNIEEHVSVEPIVQEVLEEQHDAPVESSTGETQSSKKSTTVKRTTSRRQTRSSRANSPKQRQTRSSKKTDDNGDSV